MQIGPAVSPEHKTSQTQTTDRRHAVPKARPIVRSAKNHAGAKKPRDAAAVLLGLKL